MSNEMVFTLDTIRGILQEREAFVYGTKIVKDMSWEPCIMKHSSGYDCGNNTKINFSRSKNLD